MKLKIYHILKLIFIFSVMLITSCGQTQVQDKKETAVIKNEKRPEAKSFLGEALYVPEPSDRMIERYEEHKANYKEDPRNPDKVIWFGRFAGYKGSFGDAIAIFTIGTDLFKEDARFYRHRGHRYITTRRIEEAIADLEKATQLVEGKPDQIEPDGLPNAQNIPLSTLNGNIWYHLGLAYYLKNDLDNALTAFEKGMEFKNNDDNLVSSTHWIYMILRRMGKKEEADKYLEAINKDLNIIEYIDYHKICLFYKGDITEQELLKTENGFRASDAVNYALANWYYYNDQKEMAGNMMKEILKTKTWNTFGYIAAEADVARDFNF